MLERHRIGHARARDGVHDELLGHAAPARQCDDPVARFNPDDVRSDPLDDSGNFAAGREGPRRLDLVLIADQQRVREIDAAGAYADQHLARSGSRLRDFFENERVGSARLFAE